MLYANGILECCVPCLHRILLFLEDAFLDTRRLVIRDVRVTEDSTVRRSTRGMHDRSRGTALIESIAFKAQLQL
jgi:hypothetical protein